MRQKNNQDYYFQRIIRLLRVRERSTAELRERLLRDAKDDPIAEGKIEQAIEKACRTQLLDDTRFAIYLMTKRVREGAGKKGIERELLRHNIDPGLISGWPHEFISPDTSETQRALQFIQSKPPRAKNVRKAAYQKLVRKGYSSEIASHVARTFFEQSQIL